MCELRRSSRRRTAFTLIELLVVMALLLVIAAIGLGYGVFAQDNQHSVTAANAVTGALLNAKQRARHDGLPTGIRLLFGTNGLPPAQCGQIELVQQPDDYNAPQCLGSATPTNTLNFQGVDFLGGAKYPGEIDQATVQAGDYFTSPGVPTAHLIIQVSGTPPGVQTITFPPNSLVPSMSPGAPYAIVRGPRRLASEDLISLPPSIVIDNSPFGSLPGLCQNLPLRTLIDVNNPPPGIPAAEIVFAPSGALIGQGTQADKVLLWLRDPSQPAATAGAPVLVSIQVRTGLISVYPVAPWNGGPIVVPNNDPYSFAKDGRASGM